MACIVPLLIKHFRNWRFVTACIVLFGVMHAPTWLTPPLICTVINAAAGKDAADWHRIALLCSGMCVLLILSAVATEWFNRLLNGMARRAEQQTRMALIAKVHALSLSFHEEHSSGALLSKMLRDASMIQGFLAQSVPTLLEIGGTLLVALAAPIVAGQPKVVLLYAVVVPPLVFIKWLFDKGFQDDIHRLRESMERLSSGLLEMLGMVPLARAHGVEEAEKAAAARYVEDAANQGRRMDMRMARYGISVSMCMQLPIVAALCLAGVFALRGKITPGEIGMYCSYFAMLLGAGSVMLAQYPLVASAKEAMRSIGDVLDSTEVEQAGGKRVVPAVVGGFRLEDVHFAYAPEKGDVLRGISLDVKPGQTVAIVGASGAGKSTIASLLVGFRRPTKGRILLDGADMQEIDLRSYRRFISVVPQNVVLTSGSLRENIIFGTEGVTEAALTKAVHDALLEDVVAALPGGLEAKIGENGCKLSGGQRQRIAIARAIVRNPKVLILDEAASALDSASERLVRQAIAKAVLGRTTFIVAHRLSSVRHADCIVVLKDGRIVEAGAYDELAKRSGEFCNLFLSGE